MAQIGLAEMSAESEPPKKKHRGIPEAAFLEDVDKFMQNEENPSADVVIQRLDEQHQKYKFMEANLGQKKLRLELQLPEIRSTLEAIRYMKSKKDTFDTNFVLSDQLYADAEIPPTDKVCLWLGANVMLEYSIEEAEALLSKNVDTAINSLEEISNDVNFLRDQVTTTEVNMARVYNWDVKRRQKMKNTANKR